MNENFLNIDKWIYLVGGLYQIDNWITLWSFQVYCNFNVFQEKTVNVLSKVFDACDNQPSIDKKNCEFFNPLSPAGGCFEFSSSPKNL